jgi:AcrR family transcriptional regulator
MRRNSSYYLIMAMAALAPVTVPNSEVGERIVGAALRCLARFGLSKLTLDDVAREAGCSRATLYRYFPNKSSLLFAVVATEVARLRRGLEEAVAGAATVDEVVTSGAAFGARELRRHEALQFLLAVEPGAVLPHVCFGGADRMMALVAEALAPHLGRFLSPPEAAATGEWLGRIFLSYGFETPCNSEVDIVALVRDFVLPGLPDRPRRSFT